MLKNKNDYSYEQRQYIKKHYLRKGFIFVCRILILIVFILGWELCSEKGIIDSFIFSSPQKLLIAAQKYWTDGTLSLHLKITMLETFICFGIVIIGGLIIAIIFWWNETLYKIFEPYLVVLNSLPKSALAPLFIVWLGTGMKTIIIAAVSVAIFGATISFYEHFIETDPEKINLITTLGGNKFTILFKLVIPSNKAFIINVMKVNLGLSLVGVIIGEFVAANEGLGYLILYASQVFKLDLVILCIIILGIIASVLYLALNFVEKMCLKEKE